MFSSNSGYNSVPANIEGVELSQTNPIHNNNGTPEDDDIDLEKASSNNNKTITEECFNEIRILDLKGDTYKLKNIPLNATIGDLKIEIENETEIPILLQRLIYSGKQLSDDNQTLVDAKVKDKTVIHLFKRPCPQASTVEPVIATEIGTTATAISTQQNNTIAELVNQNMATEFVPEFETYRRRVKMLACMLFLISLLNLVTILIIIMEATTMTVKTQEWISMMVELVVNVLGVIVGVYGIQGTNTLNQDKVKQYCIGLIIVGTLYIGIDLYRLVRSFTTHPDNNNSNDDGEGEGGDSKDKNDDEVYVGTDNDTIGAASFSLFFTLSIWSICFYRAFQFRHHLNLALLTESNNNEEV
mmetsp:Transcript_49405/g.63381  ORF Transcript_49405/g.63381 Transcript_49405/m.63381 type:complete len:357 (+) Transcript_49405:95-1165(+)